jgi:UPF0042 nucleotide-binding protein
MAKINTMKIKLISFGFKYGSPDNVNYLWDVRFLPNPYWVDELRAKTGCDHEVSEYVIGSSEGHSFIKQLKPFLLYLVQQNKVAEKDELVLAIGCTGGKHRSVAVAEVINDILKTMSFEIEMEHRDIDREK